MPYRRSNAAAALGEAARSWRHRSVLLTPVEAEQHKLLSWLQSRPDLRVPIPYEQIDVTVPQTPGQRVLLAGYQEPWFVRWPLVGVCWLSREPQEQQLSRINPVELLWADEPAERHARCGRAASLRAAATGEVAFLAHILEYLGWQAAAALVRCYEDDDGLYECGGAGRAPQELPSPARLLRTVLAETGITLDQIWLDELCAGGEDWDSGHQALPVPRG
jgi:hypothetical protein